jgi:hypothetical protein
VHAVVLGWKPSAGHAPDVPVQLSATSHGPADARQTVLADWKASTHVFAVPLQWSGASHAPPFDEPVHVAVLGWKPSAGHALDVPVQLSAASHGPAEARQTVLGDWKASTHVFAVPLQWSGASHAPPFDVPVQAAVLGWKPSAGHATDVPVQLSATSHEPVEARQTVLPDWKPSTHASAVPLQWSDASHSPPFDVPVQLVVEGFGVKISHRPFCGLQDAVAHWVLEAEQSTP